MIHVFVQTNEETALTALWLH